jgi:phosphatidylserine/phosphatidylglycerophosphate/cardiolipin synthase-like enzyme
MSATDEDAPAGAGEGFPLRAGNVVRPLVDGVPAFGRIAEAALAARRRLWVTIAFLDRTVALGDGVGTFFDLLDRVASRGVDVRVVFWREPRLDPAPPGWEHFPGNADERAWLRARGTRFLARWDHLPRGCHHQKSWLVDAGEPGEVAFVGGINIDRMSISAPGHRGGIGEQYHDVYAEVRGPVATDVHRNFVQRWNHASERALADGFWPEGVTGDDLPFPTRHTPPHGTVPAQIARTLRPGFFGDAPAGERSVLAQYLAAIDGARDAIYLENQFFASTEVYARLDAALARGVEVVVVVPRSPLEQVKKARKRPENAALWGVLGALGRHERFTLAGLLAHDATGAQRDVYVHAKTGLVDDRWATVGSTNFEPGSLGTDTEMNLVWWDTTTTRALRCELLSEHLAEDTATKDARAALARFRQVAHANAARLGRGEPLQGLAVAIDPARYAE